MDWFANISTIGDSLRKGEISSTELVDRLFERVEDLNPRLNALSHVLVEHARAEARRIDRLRASGKSLGDLAGVPLVIKDIIDPSPAVCLAGLPFLADYRPVEDALVVKRLRRAGAIILGVSTTDPGAFGVRTPEVTHPQASDRNVGGSSGGSGVALAAGLCFAALGTDTGGSIRIPSACCLVAGLKPTFGRVSMAGVRPLGRSLDHLGPMARCVSDLNIVQRILDPKFDRTAKKPRGERIVVGHDPDYYRDAVPKVRAGMIRALEACRVIGAEMREVSLPDPDEAQDVHAIIFCSETAAYHFAAFPNRLQEYPEVSREILERAKSMMGFQYVQSMDLRAALKRRLAAVFDKVDFVLVPTLPVLAPKREAETLEVGGVERSVTLTLVRYTCLFNHTGNPVISLPASTFGPGLGASVQVIGDLNCDADVLAFAERLEQTLDLKVDYEVCV